MPAPRRFCTPATPLPSPVTPPPSPPPAPPDHPTVLAVAALRLRHVGILAVATERLDARFPLRFVLDPRDGTLAALAPGSLRDAADGATLFAPDEHEDAAQFLVTPREVRNGPDWALADRWQAYHGRPGSGVWFSLTILSARLGSAVLEAEDLPLRSALAAHEPALCKFANAHTRALAALATRLDGHPINDALCVGVHDRGLDLRCPAGVLHVPFPSTISDPDAAREAITTILGV